MLHLGHVLSSDLSNDEDTVAKRKDLCRKANLYAEHLHPVAIISQKQGYFKASVYHCIVDHYEKLLLNNCILWKIHSTTCSEKFSMTLPWHCHTSILHNNYCIQYTQAF